MKRKLKKQIERTEIEELNKDDYVRVKCHLHIHKKLKEVKAGNEKLINVVYTPEIYKIFKVLQEDHPGFERKRYTLEKLDGTPLHTESKANKIY